MTSESPVIFSPDWAESILTSDNPFASPSSSSQLTTENNETNCFTNDCYPPEHILERLQAYIFPTTIEWVLITAHLIVFLVGLVGNALVCSAVYRNHTMHSVTNYFIFNLAVADFMVILFCLPPTVVWDVTETWFFGDALCKIILYLQTVSVAVSVLTLSGISVERWYAICYPLKFKATTKRAKRVIFIIWIISLIFAAPELIVLETLERDDLNVTTVYLTQCTATWSFEYEATYVTARILALYLVPLSFMSLAYYKIVRVLWSSANIPGNHESPALTTSNCHNNHNGHTYVNCNAQLHLSTRGQTAVLHPSAVDHQLNQRRKAAKMLVAVVAVFALSYLPVHIFSIAAISSSIEQTELVAAIAMVVHWLPYANSAVNPVIYNFMSGKFRREFARAFQECFCCTHSYAPATSRVYSYNHHYSLRNRNIHRV